MLAKSVSSILKYRPAEIWRIEMYPLPVTDDQIFSTQRRVTDDQSSSNLASNSKALYM